MRELHVVEQYGQVTVTTSDGRKAVGATVQSAMEKLFGPRAWASLGIAFGSIKETPDKSNIVRGRAR